MACQKKVTLPCKIFVQSFKILIFVVSDNRHATNWLWKSRVFLSLIQWQECLCKAALSNCKYDDFMHTNDNNACFRFHKFSFLIFFVHRIFLISSTLFILSNLLQKEYLLCWAVNSGTNYNFTKCPIVNDAGRWHCKSTRDQELIIRCKGK